MKKLIQLIDKKMIKNSSCIKDLKTEIKYKQVSKNTFELIKLNPDNANYDKLLEIVGEEYKDDIDYILKFKGWMKEYNEEEQVKIAIKKLSHILAFGENKFNNELNNLNEELEKLDKENEQYKVLREKISTYTKKTYIEENEFNIICDFIDQIEDKVAIQILQQIGKNNAFIELEKIGKLELIESLNGEVNLDTLEEMNKTRNSNEMNEDRNSIDYITKKIDESIKYLKNIDINSELYQYVNDVFGRVNNIKDKITKKMLDEAKLFKDDIDSIDKYDMYSLTLILLLIEIIDNKDIDKLNDIYLKQCNNTFFNALSEEEQLLIEKYRKLFKDIYDEYFDNDFYTNFNNSYSSFNQEELQNYTDSETVQSIKIMDIISKNNNKINMMNLDELKSLYDELNNEILIYKDMLCKDLECEENVDGLDIYDVSNYIVIRDKDYLFNNINNLLDEYNDVSPSLFTRALNRLYVMQSTDLFTRSKCKPIMHDSNVYDIHEDRSGCIRILFRTFYTKEGKVFYEVLSFAYGSCGPIKKTKNLIQSVKEYSKNYNEYISIENEFRNSNYEVMNKYITDGLNLYNELILRENEKKKGFNLND